MLPFAAAALAAQLAFAGLAPLDCGDFDVWRWPAFQNENAVTDTVLRHHFRGRGADATFDRINAVIARVHASQDQALARTERDIDRLLADGRVGASDGAELRSRLRIEHAARLSYLHGNMYRRVIAEMLDDWDEWPPELKSGLVIEFTDRQFKKITRAIEFDPQAYGLPVYPPETVE